MYMYMYMYMYTSYIYIYIHTYIRTFSDRGSQIPEPPLPFTSEYPSKVQISRWPGPFCQIGLSKAGRNPHNPPDNTTNDNNH